MYDMSTGPSTNYARFEQRSIPLNCLAGLELAQMTLGLDNSMIEAIVGRYSRGKRKGQLRGAVSYQYCVHGGWVRYQGVVRRGAYGEPKIVDSWSGCPI